MVPEPRHVAHAAECRFSAARDARHLRARALYEVFVRVYRLVAKCREVRREQELLARRQDGDPRAPESSWHAEEQRRRKELLNEVRRWHDAKLIRAYVEHVRKQSPQALEQESWVEWRRWALQVAAELDPTATRLKGE
jgi:uncharacterized protein (UPF0305 family)